MNRKITIFVDADACPVNEEIRTIAAEFRADTVYVASYAAFHRDDRSKWVFVDQRKEEADLYIVNHVRSGDVCVTQDLGLAGLLTVRGVYVLSVRGTLISETRIGALLQRRYLAYKRLRSGKRVRGPAAFTREHHRNFSSALTKLLCHLVKQDIN
ncbi:YaiI/YqxD family protein [Sporolactobacillus vineae]|uniref:YaiI/YqxD family protein n=1 Tax=Sporolactobacillus vineae TaxID=444463 RepID=UPI0002881B47|nr:DUF188 domain-containing protein [Sporolactobacillus vineae]